MKFRKRPVVVEAEQFDSFKGTGRGVLRVWMSADGRVLGDYSMNGKSPEGADHTAWAIETLEGWHVVSEGDWIITGVKGERYPCKDDIFRATYEPVEG